MSTAPGRDDARQGAGDTVPELGAAGVDRLLRLRALFVEAVPSHRRVADYWEDEELLALYDATLGRRIAWKWAAVLRELRARGFAPPGGTVLDWGCGTGVAARAYLEAFGATGVLIHDRSARALDFARRTIAAAAPGVAVHSVDPGAAAPDVLLVSHVLNEVDVRAFADLLALARRSRALVWVEAGARPVSRRLSEVHDELLPAFDVLAPCPHQERCGVRAPGREDAWCHHFADPPPQVARDSGWSRLARALGIDLSDLPCSFLAMVPKGTAAAGGPASRARVLGRPRVEKACARLLACRAGGLADLEVRKRDDPALFRAARKGLGEMPLFDLDAEGRLRPGTQRDGPRPE